jgi:threonylcarbamoyladenosine tRNA methylthiotransferase MtaB
MRVAVTTLGCKVNQYDSATIESRLREVGCEVVTFAPGADVYIVNSCTVTDRADAESRQLVRRARRFNASARVIMTGCFAQVSPQRAAIPEVDHVVGLNRLPDLIRAVRGELAAAAERVLVDDLRTARRVRTLGAQSFTGQTRAFLKIQEGCDLFCSFCIVPMARGRSRSVSPRQVLAQLEMLAQRGFQEVVLTGVHLGGYGRDLAPAIDLCDLLEMLVAQPPVPRLRLSSIDPPEVTPRLLRLMARSPALCPHLHIPLQAGHDDVLRRMRRKYDVNSVRALGREIRATLPDAAFGTDLIAGFPGETDAQFEATLDLLGELPLTYFHVFPYSRRSGTTAAKLADQVEPACIKGRAERLRTLGARKRAAFASRFVGATMQVLVEATPVRTPGRVQGYSRNYQRVEVCGAPNLANHEVLVEITAAQGATLLAQAASVRSSRE